MNEKFKLLALEAKMGTADFDAGSFYVATPDKMQRFAELIVRECINVSEEHAFWLEAQPFDPEIEQYEDGIVNGIYKATAAIKKHFGVEE